MQIALNAEQVEAFYHDVFVTSQLEHFQMLVAATGVPAGTIIDVGGGQGYFAEALQQRLHLKVQVLDSDSKSIAACHERGISAVQGDALDPSLSSSPDIASFNLILHHLVGSSERETLAMQSAAVSSWRERAGAVFVNEYIYDSYLPEASGRLIYWITRNRIFSTIGRWISALVPSLRANTFGVGVRFREHAEWVRIFEGLGFRLGGVVKGPEENVSFARRMLLIQSCRRDSFLLLPDKPFGDGCNIEYRGGSK